MRAFCEASLENLAFLEELGVPFPPRADAPKTSYPPDDCTLYFSGNELCPPFNREAKAAPRGHRVLGKGAAVATVLDRGRCNERGQPLAPRR